MTDNEIEVPDKAGFTEVYLANALGLRKSKKRGVPVFPGELLFDYSGDFVGIYCGYDENRGWIYMPEEHIWKKQ